jgi:uncharacterized protein
VTAVAIGTYEPVWQRDGVRVAGSDEDIITLAVAAGRVALGAAPGADVQRVVIVTHRPDVLEGVARGVVAIGLGLSDELPVELRIGGAPVALDALASAGSATLLIAVDAVDPAGAAAALVAEEEGAEVVPAGRVGRSLPMRVQRTGEAHVRLYDDARLERDRGWRPIWDGLASEGAVAVGIPPRDAVKLSGVDLGVPVVGAASAFFALAAMAAQGRDGRIVAIDAGEGAAFDVSGTSALAVAAESREAVPESEGPRPPRYDAEIPISLPAYERALPFKVGMVAARCACGELSFPPRTLCLACGRDEVGQPESLPRTGEVYSAVTVHAPVPGIAGPYGLAIVSLDGVPLRVLAHVTDAPAAHVGIGTRGRLVLRRVAVREGISDYGYGFQPEPIPQEAAA